MEKYLAVKKEINIEGIYTFYYLEHDKDFYFEGEKHDFWEMVYVDSGSIQEETDSKSYILSQGSVIFHKPMEFHCMRAIYGKPHNVVVSCFETKSEAMRFFENKIFTVNLKQRKILSTYTEEMINEFGYAYPSEDYESANKEKNTAGAFQIGIAEFERFLIELMRENCAVERSAVNKKDLKKNVENVFSDSVKDYLKENVYNTLSLSEICGHFNMCRSNLCKIFKEETGKSVIDCYIELKIAEAKLLIREGSLNITQIAEKLGYSGIHHFTRIFKSRVKISPSDYAKSVKR